MPGDRHPPDEPTAEVPASSLPSPETPLAPDETGSEQATTTDPAPAQGTAAVVGQNGIPGQGWGQFTLENVARPLGIAGMLTCVAISLSQLIGTVSTQWPGVFITVAVLLASLESIYAYRLLEGRRLDARDVFRFRFVEWVVLILFMRFGVYTMYGAQRLVADMAAWTLNAATFFDGIFIIGTVLLAIFWYLALMLARAMHELEATALERMPSITDPDHYLRSTMPHHGLTDRQALLGRIMSTFFGGGALLLVLAGLSRVDVRDLMIFRHGPSSGVILNVLIYFLIGLLIISQAQYTLLRANWDLQGIPVLGRMARRWLLLVLAFLALVGLAAALLPVGYSVGLMASLSSAVQWAFFAIAQVLFLVIFVLSWVISQIMSLFSGKPPSNTAETFQPAMAPPAPPPTVALGPSPWWQVARSLIFWLVLTGLLGYSLVHFFGDRFAFLRRLSLGRLGRWLAGLWRGLGRGTRGIVRSVRESLARRAARRLAQQPRAWRYLSLTGLSARDKVRYYYVSVLQRAAQQGLGRPPGTTPLEHAPALARAMPEAARDIGDLTQAFLVARYSEHPVGPQDVRGLAAVWKAVRRALLLRKRASQPPGT